MSEQPPYRVFLSYSMQDQNWVREFASALHDKGVSSWFDATQIAPGESLAERIEEALRESRVLVLIVNPRTIRNPSMSFELGAAVADKKRIIPVLMEDVPAEDVPPWISRYQLLRESSPRRAGERVAEALNKPGAS